MQRCAEFRILGVEQRPLFAKRGIQQRFGSPEQPHFRPLCPSCALVAPELPVHFELCADALGAAVEQLPRRNRVANGFGGIGNFEQIDQNWRLAGQIQLRGRLSAPLWCLDKSGCCENEPDQQS